MSNVGKYLDLVDTSPFSGCLGGHLLRVSQHGCIFCVPYEMTPFGHSWQIAIPCNLASALFLNLRAQFYKKDRDPSSQFTDDTFQSRLSSL